MNQCLFSSKRDFNCQTNFTLKRILHIGFLFCLLFSCSKDTLKPADDTNFIKVYGSFSGNLASGLDLTADNGFIIAGTKDSLNTGSLVYVLKTDSRGAEVWHFVSGNETNGNDFGIDVKKTSDGGAVVLCNKSFNQLSNSNSDSTDIHLLKLDKDGRLLIDANLAVIDPAGHLACEGKSLQQTADGGFLISAVLKMTGSTQMYIVKTDASFKVLYANRYGSTFLRNEVNALQVASATELVWCGTDFRKKVQQADPAFGDFRVTKTNNNGGILFDRTYIYFNVKFNGTDGYASQQDDQATDIALTPEGYIAAGFINQVQNDESGSNEDSQIVLMSLFPDGTERWTKIFGGTGKDKALGVFTEGNNYLVTGYSTDPTRKRQVFLQKFDPNGNPLWDDIRLFGGSGNDYGKVVKGTPDGGYVMLATVEQTGIRKICLIKTNSEGKLSD